MEENRKLPQEKLDRSLTYQVISVGTTSIRSQGISAKHSDLTSACEQAPTENNLDLYLKLPQEMNIDFQAERNSCFGSRSSGITTYEELLWVE
ncbi:unnamed protein product [Albugo candida]|uniref:Uncharacterized protein n=1 Tax=Albugo candida TaxID=65357 RepID=A0A024FXF9_9STRA|nr:unnamed protein product [Albugo candida]|eukprot:CCI11582.1 unnamed protein product [Albugo candida]